MKWIAEGSHTIDSFSYYFDPETKDNESACLLVFDYVKKKKQKEQIILQFIMQPAFKTFGGLTLPNTPLSFTWHPYQSRDTACTCPIRARSTSCAWASDPMVDFLWNYLPSIGSFPRACLLLSTNSFLTSPYLGLYSSHFPVQSWTALVYWTQKCEEPSVNAGSWLAYKPLEAQAMLVAQILLNMQPKSSTTTKITEIVSQLEGAMETT